MLFRWVMQMLIWWIIWYDELRWYRDKLSWIVNMRNSVDHNCRWWAYAIIKAINGLQLCKVVGQCAEITIYICSCKAIVVQGSSASHYSGQLIRISIWLTENKFFNISASARPIRKIIQDQSRVHHCAILFCFWRAWRPSWKRSSNNSRLSRRLSAHIIKIKIQFLSLNLYHSHVDNCFHIVFYK